MKTSEFDFDLPPELIAQEPPAARGASRLLVLDRQSGAVEDRAFGDLSSLLRPGDLIVLNDTKVFAARLLGRRMPGGGRAECLLLRRLDADASAGEHPGPAGDEGVRAAERSSPTAVDEEDWEALVHPGQRLKQGSRLEFGSGPDRIGAEILARRFHGRRTVRLRTEGRRLRDVIDRIGHVPLPPYIKRADAADDRARYQTVYARVRGSVAAPTAGLHFTDDILADLEAGGIERATLTLHVGYGTFQPIRTDEVERHRMDVEHYRVPPETADALNRAIAGRRRIIAVGTTTTRALESLRPRADGRFAAGAGSTELFIAPGHRFRLVSGLVTNFHLPRSSLLLLVSAFAGRSPVLAAYRHAVAEGYRFYSYGDAMLIL